METIRNWAAMFCAASLVGAFIVFLLPEGSMKKPVQIVLSFLLLIVAFWPLSEKLEFTFSELKEEIPMESEDYSAHLNADISRSGQKLIEDEISGLLKEICAKSYTVHAEMKEDGDGNIALSKITITIAAEDSVRESLIQKRVGDLTGIVPEVEVE